MYFSGDGFLIKNHRLVGKCVYGVVKRFFFFRFHFARWKDVCLIEIHLFYNEVHIRFCSLSFLDL